MTASEEAANTRRCRDPNRLPNRGYPDGSPTDTESLDGFLMKDEALGMDSESVDLSTNKFNREATPTTNTSMKRFIKMLPALGLVFGATLAMAMNFAEPDQTGTLKAFVNNDWVEIPESSNYHCNEEEVSCVARFDENDDMISGTLIEGEYAPLD